VFTGDLLMTEDRTTTDSLREADSIVELDTFEALYRTWAPDLYRYCFRRLGSVENAEDATSQIFQQAFRGRAGFHGGSVPAWLFRIAERVLIDHYRAAKPTTTIDFADEIEDHAPGPDEQAIRSDDVARLDAAIATLPELRRHVIELRLAGLTSPEIARILERSPDWVRTTQRRAVLQLQATLQVTPESGGTRDV
jgi:RNA polymerase sigma-70 factor (ECF subfamily)